MLTHKDEKRLRALAREMNQILDNSEGLLSFNYDPPKYRYDKERDGYRLRREMEKKLQELADSGTIPTRIEISRQTEWLMGLDQGGNSDLIYVEDKNDQYPYYGDTDIMYLNKHYRVEVKVRRDIGIFEGDYHVYVGEERIK